MNIQALPLEYQKADEKRRAQDARAIQQSGHGATTGSMAITRRYVPQLAQALTAQIENALTTRRSDATEHALASALKKLPSELLALCTLQSLMQSIGQEDTLRDTCVLVGTNVNAEMWAQKLSIENPQLATNIDRAIRKRHSSVKQRRQAARSAATRAGFNFTHWTRADRLHAGGWLVDVAVNTLALVFERVLRADGEHMITVTDGAMDIVQDALREVMMAHPVMQPVAHKLAPWVSWRMPPQGETRDSFNVTFLRAIHPETAAAAKAAIQSGQMKPALDAVNALQDVAWTINHEVLDVMKACIKHKINVPGLPPAKDLPKPAYPKPWDDMEEKEQKLWKLRASETKQLNRSYVGQRILLAEDMLTAERMAQHERFYTPMNCDWRGRVYAKCHFNFQREDRVRGLFKFAEGEPIGEEGLWWLKVHVANCGDFDKISKRPMKERVEWTTNFASQIDLVARDPLQPSALACWTKADQPFLFLAACVELTAAIKAGPGYITTLPVSFDGSCSGLQHLCAMTRAQEGALVNLTPQAEPQDVYQTVADIVRENVSLDETPLAKAWLDYGIDRKVVKRNVMTYSYSSKKFGMAAQQEEDLITPLNTKVLSGEVAEHPFSYWAEKKHRDAPSPAAAYIAKHTYAAIEAVVEKPAEAMAFLQKLAKALAHEGKPATWVTPVGIPWINRYHEIVTSRVVLYMHDKGVKTAIKVVLAVGSQKDIDKNRASNGVAPNFVHALDAAHLMLVANAAVAEGIALATVHDSFGCLASRAGRFNQIIRAEFVRMYETHDLLSEVFEQAKCDLTQANWHRLPDVPARGPLNIQEVVNADYCFA